MRKTVIALIMLLPMVFVLAVFSSLNIVSLTVPVSVSGIKLLADGDMLPAGEGLELDMADGRDHTVTAEVEPANASEKGYTLESDNTSVLTVDGSGRLTALMEGTANVTATSKDKGFTASLPVVVTSSAAYGVSFELLDMEGNSLPLTYNEGSATYAPKETLNAGKYGFRVTVMGGDSGEFTLETQATEADPNGIHAIVDRGEQSVTLPFSGRAELKLEVPNALVNGLTNRTITRTVSLSVAKPQSETGIVVNGVADGSTVLLATGSTQTTVYVECEGEPNLSGEGIKEVRCLVHDGDKTKSGANALNAPQARSGEEGNAHILEVTLEEGFSAEELMAELTTPSGKKAPVKFSFALFDFILRSATISEGVVYSSVILNGTATAFYAVPAVELNGVEFKWESEDPDELNVTPNSNGYGCTFKASKDGTYMVTVTAMRGEERLGTKQVEVTVATKVNSIWITNKLLDERALAERYTVAGQKFNGEQIVPKDDYTVDIKVTKKGSQLPVANDFAGIKAYSSDASVAELQIEDGHMYLVIKGTGAVTVTAEWEYNALFNSNATRSVQLNVVEDAVEVSNYPQLRTATESGRKVVLVNDIMLGTDASGEPLPLEQRQSIANAQRIRSTYNTEFYSTPDQFNKHTPDEAYVMYAQEFTADVYGNGCSINAEYFTHSYESTGKPLIFKGPLVFVEYKGVASVAGQDNIAFLVRTDGVTLYGVNLLGCSDESLLDDNGNYELSNLNLLGTTLEINADCRVVNCRIRNGRNVVRVYGGNSDGKSYMVQGVPSVDLDKREQIEVEIDGCIITQGREFLVKMGANKALKASTANGQEPQLRDANGRVYEEQTKKVGSKSFGTNNYTVGDVDKDSFFYKRYVMTDLTLRNTVLETSGLFCVGVESNFSGGLLYNGADSLGGNATTYASLTKAWRNSGGTSFAGILRLEGDVRTYDWKDIAQIDSSTLIEPVGDGGLSELMKFNVAAMLKEVNGMADYAKLLYTNENGSTFVHGGIAFYGGGRNYSQIDLSGLAAELNNFEHLAINIGQFANVDSDGVVKRQAELLPYAAGTHDFNFWMYAADGANNYAKQQSDASSGTKYRGVTPVPLFATE